MKKTIMLICVICLLLVTLFLFPKGINYITSLKSEDVLKTKIDDIFVYGESLDIKINNKLENVIKFKNVKKNDIEYRISTGKEIDKGILPTKISPGDYYLMDIGEKHLYSPENINIEYWTITRNGVNYKITIKTTASGLLKYSKKKEKLPENYYDILIDPGHGGEDVGSIGIDGVTTEAEINLNLSMILLQKLRDAGYKVGITRTTDVNPGSCSSIGNYCDNGRISQSYELYSRLFLNVHHNAGLGSGFEIYSSYLASEDFSEIIKTKLLEISSPSTKETNKVEEGIYQRTFIDDEHNLLRDYYFALRETGGRATRGISEDNLDNSTSRIGSQAVLLEFGYIDNETDFVQLINSEFQEKEAELITEAVNEYLESTT